MNNTALFEKVASGELTPEEAVAIMMEEDRKAWDARCPRWIPLWVWRFGYGL